MMMAYIFLNWPIPASFLFILVFLYNKYLVASRIWTRIIGAVGESADH